MKNKLTKCTLLANTITATAGTMGLLDANAPTNTGLGLLSIAAISTSNTLVKNQKLKKNIAALILAGNIAIASGGIATMLDENKTNAAGMGQIALAGASAVQCLRSLGMSDEKNSKKNTEKMV